MGSYVSFERRCFARLQEDITLDIQTCCNVEDDFLNGQHKTTVMNGHIMDISAGGMLLRASTIIPVNTLIKVNATLPGWQKYNVHAPHTKYDYLSKPFKALGKVLRVDMNPHTELYRIAVKFIDLEPMCRNSLDRFVKDRLVA